MFNIIKKSIELGGRTLTLETGRVARQANGSVLVTYGETVVLCTATAAAKAAPNQDFFPLTVNYQEKTYAAGKIPGGFFKREGKNSEKEVLTSRLIDRPIRPLFPEGYRNETQVICTVLSYDQENDADVPAIIGASAALAISEIPFQGPISASRIALIDGEFVLNPTKEQTEKTQLDLVVAGTKDSIMMVESSASELIEDDMLEALKFAQASFSATIDLVNELAKEVAKTKWEVVDNSNSDLYKKIRDKYQDAISKNYSVVEKKARKDAIEETKNAVVTEFKTDELEESEISSVLHDIEKEIVRKLAIDGKRIDGRDLVTVRQIVPEINVLPRVHGSALFTRGETQALAVVTLGTADDEQIIDSLSGGEKEKFMLHYNFPPFSVGEVSPLRAPGRREIGHGKLAKRALTFVMPDATDFNYTVRIVSEVTESNGSSSMATVCSSSLALMQAGVPIKKPVAGIAMGLILEKDNFAILSDIMGDEDHLGDMDFKVAGTEEGITALQMDIKVPGITFEIITKALEQARQGRLHILKEMSNAITETSKELSPYVPLITNFMIPEKKIRDVIGSGGKVIRKICDDFDVKVSIEDNGQVSVSGVGKETVDKAVNYIEMLVEDPEIGRIYEGKVEKITEYGAFVSFLANAYGLIHISEFAEDHVESVFDYAKEGQVLKFRVIGKDGDKLRLSFRSALNEDETEESFKENYRNTKRSSYGDKPNRRGAGARKGGSHRDKPHRDRGEKHSPNGNKREEAKPEKKKKKGFFW